MAKNIKLAATLSLVAMLAAGGVAIAQGQRTDQGPRQNQTAGENGQQGTVPDAGQRQNQLQEGDTTRVTPQDQQAPAYQETQADQAGGARPPAPQPGGEVIVNDAPPPEGGPTGGQVNRGVTRPYEAQPYRGSEQEVGYDRDREGMEPGSQREQGLYDTPRIDQLSARLRDPEVRFNAKIADVPTDDVLERGRLVAMGGGQNLRQPQACMSCHAADGAGDGSGAYPRLTGQPAWYLYKQLVDYATGARPNSIMTPIAQAMLEEEMEAVAAYYSVVEAPYPEFPELIFDTSLQWGAKLASAGSEEKGIPACSNCHGAQGMGVPPSVPYLAGQYAEYIALQLELWKEDVRDNDALNVMHAIAEKMTREDMIAVGRYYERVQPFGNAYEPPTGEVGNVPRYQPGPQPDILNMRR